MWWRLERNDEATVASPSRDKEMTTAKTWSCCNRSFRKWLALCHTRTRATTIGGMVVWVGVVGRRLVVGKSWAYDSRAMLSAYWSNNGILNNYV